MAKHRDHLDGRHWSSPFGLRRWKGFAMGTARSATGGPKAGPGGTSGAWTSAARSYKSQVNGLICPPEGTPKYSRLKFSPRALALAPRNSAENILNFISRRFQSDPRLLIVC